MTVQELEGQTWLFFNIGDLPVTEAAMDSLGEKGLEPNGYFWAGIIDFLNEDRELGLDLEHDPEADGYAGMADGEGLNELAEVLTPYVRDEAKLLELVDRALEAGIDLED